MGSGASQREDSVSESPLSSPPSTEIEAQSSDRPPIIIVTAPSRDNIYATPSTITIAEAMKEQRPGSAPFVVGKKIVNRR